MAAILVPKDKVGQGPSKYESQSCIRNSYTEKQARISTYIILDKHIYNHIHIWLCPSGPVSPCGMVGGLCLNEDSLKKCKTIEEILRKYYS